VNWTLFAAIRSVRVEGLEGGRADDGDVGLGGFCKSTGTTVGRQDPECCKSCSCGVSVKRLSTRPKPKKHETGYWVRPGCGPTDGSSRKGLEMLAEGYSGSAGHGPRAQLEEGICLPAPYGNWGRCAAIGCQEESSRPPDESGMVWYRGRGLGRMRSHGRLQRINGMSEARTRGAEGVC
jgi:hypothetical protein